MIQETTIKGVLGTHAEAGYIIISAFRDGDGDPDTLKKNLALNKILKRHIQQSGYSHTIVWGGFKEQETGKIVREQSFMVFNFKRKADAQDDAEYIKKFGRVMCRKFKQDAYFFKEPGNGRGYYIDKTGKINATFGNVKPTKAADIYFTSLAKSRNKNNLKKSFTFEGKRFD